MSRIEQRPQVSERESEAQRRDVALFQQHRKRERVRRALKHGVYSGFGFFLAQLTFRELTGSEMTVRFMVVAALISIVLVGVLSGIGEYVFARKDDA